MRLSAASDTCLVLLLRHGATESNLATPPILQGRSIDGPLSTEGRHQANLAARALAPISIRAVYSSPLRRAQETGAAIAAPHHLDVTTVTEITEVDVGAWERRSWQEIAQTEPIAYANFHRDPAQHGYREGENLQQVAERVVPAIHAAASRHYGEAIAIIGHNVVNRVFLAHALGMSLSHARRIIQHNTGINLLTLQGDKWTVEMINSSLHLIEADHP